MACAHVTVAATQAYSSVRTTDSSRGATAPSTVSNARRHHAGCSAITRGVSPVPPPGNRGRTRREGVIDDRPGHGTARDGGPARGRPALRLDDHVVTYRAFLAAAQGVAGVLRALGIEPGSRVGLVGTDRPAAAKGRARRFLTGPI